MKSVILLTAAMIASAVTASAQFEMLGKDLARIRSHIDNDPEYEAVIDTLDENTILVKGRGAEKYPYFSYEIDINKDECVCVGFVSRNREVFNAYINILSSLGKLVWSDSTNVDFRYEIIRMDGENGDNGTEKLYYTIQQPYRNSALLTQRNIFSITVTKDSD